MKYRFLGKSGLLVSRVCLGTMTFGNKDWGCNQKDASGITSKFIDNGGNFIDTADLYSGGLSEEMLGMAIKNYDRSDLVIASKCWFPTSEGINSRGLSRKHIIEACEGSLKRLKTDYIDVYHVHGPDPYTPIEETIRTLDDLVRDGKVRYIAFSNFFAWQVVKANSYAESNNYSKFIGGQYLYNLIRRDIETEIIPACVDQGVGITCWSPLASGLLTGKYQGEDKPTSGSRHALQSNIQVPRHWSEKSLEFVDKLVDLSREIGKTPTVCALSWLLHKNAITSVVVGAKSIDQLDDSLGAGEWDIPDKEYKYLEELLPHDHGYPDDWMKIAFPATFGKQEFAPDHVQKLPVLNKPK